LKKRRDAVKEILDDEITKNHNMMVMNKLPSIDAYGNNREVYE